MNSKISSIPGILFAGLFFLFLSSAVSAVIVNPGESIQAAIDSLPADGGVVELAAGLHAVSDEITFNKSNIIIQGIGNAIINSTNPSANLFVFLIRIQLGMKTGLPSQKPRTSHLETLQRLVIIPAAMPRFLRGMQTI